MCGDPDHPVWGSEGALHPQSRREVRGTDPFPSITDIGLLYSEDRISETSTASVMMMNECPCAWDDCDVIMNNAINLRDHLVGHVAKMEFEVDSG